MEEELADFLTSYAINPGNNTFHSRLEEINLDSNKINLECANYHTISLLSHTKKIMLGIFPNISEFYIKGTCSG